MYCLTARSTSLPYFVEGRDSRGDVEQDKMRPGSSLFWEDHLNLYKTKLDDNKPDYLQLSLSL